MSDSSDGIQNALAKSRSPYLLQHAANPVEWMEWSDTAFAEARKRDVPIFLSIGYSTCHWCHVMAHESFEDVGIANRMNDLFVNIKLDREERPDVDRIYMSYVQSTTGSGGWPMSVWLTPDLKPFYGGTYFPPEDKYGRVGFLTLIERIGNIWTDDRSTLIGYGAESEKLLRDNASQDIGDTVSEARMAIDLCVNQLKSEYDEIYGGFGGAPKFPMPPYFNLLIEEVARGRNSDLTEMLSESLAKMAKGGIWDHVGGGFHRYSVDKYWHIPHYEKMLYDQGQLASVYAEAYRLTGREAFADVARGIVSYVRRDLLGSRGEIYAAEDADSALPDDLSKHGEGAFYVWSQAELDRILNVDAASLAQVFDVKPDGNARPESDPHGELSGMNTLMRVKEIPGLDVEACLTKLFRARAERPRPHLDDKAIVSWNALMISGACKTYQACGDEAGLELALNAGTFLFEHMWNQEKRAFHRAFRETCGEALGFAEDYAAAVNACVDLYECTFDTLWLERAQMVVRQLITRFLDKDRGGFFATEASDKNVLVRLRDDSDGAEPAASSMAALGLLRLAALLDDVEMRDMARKSIEAFGVQWKRAPRAMPLMLVAASRFLESDQQVVVVGDLKSKVIRDLIRVANRWRKPYSVLVALNPTQSLSGIFAKNEKLEPMLAAGSGVYVCDNYTCQKAVSNAEALESMLR